MMQFRIKAHTGPLNSDEHYYEEVFRSHGFTEVYQGSEHVYGSIQLADHDIRNAQEYARSVLGPRFTLRSVRVIGAFEVEE